MPWLRSISDPSLWVWAPVSTSDIVIRWLNLQELNQWLGDAFAWEYIHWATDVRMMKVRG
jgi:hypothetical protein